jgi:hypothetical protein
VTCGWYTFGLSNQQYLDSEEAPMADIAPTSRTPSMPSQSDGRPEQGLSPLRVRYYRVYAVDVFWQTTAKPQRGELTVRLIGAGAQILPAEQIMDAGTPDAKAVFYVTPLAKGWLANQKLEVLAQGCKVQEIPMASKVTSQRLTWFLLLCTILVPWFITEELKHSPMTDTSRLGKAKGDQIIYRKIAKEVEDYIKDNVPALPDFLKDTFVEKGLLQARSAVAASYQKVVEIATWEPIAFYVGTILFALTLISAFIHKPKRTSTVGKPIPLSALGYE